MSFSQIMIDNNYKNQYEKNKSKKKKVLFLLNIQHTKPWYDEKSLSQDFE
jgi:hypothetical protein